MVAAGADALAFWVTAPGQGELRAETLQEPGPQEVRVRALYSGVSRGTEALVFRGGIPVTEYARMRAPFQAGEFPAPVKYGYASVGVVEQGPAPWPGRTVFCLYPHQDRYVVPADAVLPVPEAVPAARAVLAANMETALNGVWDADLAARDRVAVIGAGVVGTLVAWLVRRLTGAQVLLVDIDPARESIARRLDLPFATPVDALSTGAGRMNRVVHASGAGAGLELALELAAFEALVVEMSWYGAQRVSLPLGGAFHSQRLTLRSSQVGSVAPSHRGEWSHRRRLAHALELLADPALDVLVNSESTLAELPAAMARLAAAPAGVLCHRVTYRESHVLSQRP